MSKTGAEAPRPRWWRPLWLAVLVITAISIAVSFFIQRVPLEIVLGAAALTFLMIGIAYYIRIRPSMKVNRAIYIWIGITPIGFGLWIVFIVLSGVGLFLTTYLGPGPGLIVGLIVPLTIGAFIGDWIGKRRNYRLPLSLP
jgi:hypothetical protein